MAGNGIWSVDKITLKLYPGAVPAMGEAAAANAAAKALEYVREELRGHDDTGLLSASFRVRRVNESSAPYRSTYEVYSDVEYARWVNDGTGIYGPYGSPIVSPTGRVMTFNPGRRNSGVAGVGRSRLTGQFTGSVYARSVEGQKPVAYLEKALARIRIRDFLL